MSKLTVIAKKELDCELIREYSTHANDLGKHQSTMTLYQPDDGNIFIEWDIPDIDETCCINFEVYGNKIVEFEGIISMPKEAIALLEEEGYDCTEIK